MTSTVQVIPDACWTRSVARPGMWVYQDSGAAATIEWHDDGGWTVGATATWRFASGPPVDYPTIGTQDLRRPVTRWLARTLRRLHR